MISKTTPMMTVVAGLLVLGGAVASMILGWGFSRFTLRPISSIERTARKIGGHNLGERIPVPPGDDELASLSRLLNETFDRIEAAFDQVRQFTADASHELKTPLAIMRGTLEQGLEKCRNAPEAQEAFSKLLEQTDRQGAILESLLLLSRADAGKLEISAERIDLSGLLETWLEDASLLAEARDITIHSEIEPGIEIDGDPVLLQQVAHNLFSNAVRYNEEGGVIDCRLRRTGNGIEWKIANTGDALAEADRERIFDRFERGCRANDASEAGVGLGLSLVKEIVTAHGGSVTAGVTDEGLTTMMVSLPT